MKIRLLIFISISVQLSAQEIRKFDIMNTINYGLNGRVKQTYTVYYGKKRDKRNTLIIDASNVINKQDIQFEESGKINSEKFDFLIKKELSTHYQFEYIDGYLSTKVKKNSIGEVIETSEYSFVDSQTYRLRTKMDSSNKKYSIETIHLNLYKRDSVETTLYYVNDTLATEDMNRYSYYPDGNTKQLNYKRTDYNKNSNEYDSEVYVYQYLTYDEKKNWTELKIVNKHNNETQYYMKREIEYYGN